MPRSSPPGFRIPQGIRSALHLASLAAILVSGAISAHAATWYVSATASSSGTGTSASPWALSALVTNIGKVQPGDTVNLAGKFNEFLDLRGRNVRGTSSMAQIRFNGGTGASPASLKGIYLDNAQYLTFENLELAPYAALVKGTAPSPSYQCPVLVDRGDVSFVTFNNLNIHDGWVGVAINPGGHDLSFNNLTIARTWQDGVCISPNLTPSSDRIWIIGGSITETGYMGDPTWITNGIFAAGGSGHAFKLLKFKNNFNGYSLNMCRGGSQVTECTFRNPLMIGSNNRDALATGATYYVYRNKFVGPGSCALGDINTLDPASSTRPGNGWDIFSNTFINTALHFANDVGNGHGILSNYANIYLTNNLFWGPQSQVVMTAAATGYTHSLGHNAWFQNAVQPAVPSSGGDLLADPAFDDTDDYNITSSHYWDKGTTIVSPTKTLTSAWYKGASPDIGMNEHDPDRDLTFTVQAGAGVVGFPVTGTYGYLPGKWASWSYSAAPGYAAPTVTLNDFNVAPAGDVTMDNPQSLTAMAGKQTFVVSGNAGVAGATLSYPGGSTASNAAGAYSFNVDSGWSGTITPSLAGWTFVPANAVLSNVTSSKTQDFGATAVRTCKVTFQAAAGGAITGNLTQTVLQGGSATSTCQANAGYQFVDWTGSNGFNDTGNPVSVANVNSDMTITANFTAKATGVTYWVDSTSKASTADGKSGSPWKTLAGLMTFINNKAPGLKAGDRVNIKGVFNETLLINGGVNGTSSAPIVFSGSLGNGSGGAKAKFQRIILRGAAYATFEDLEVAPYSEIPWKSYYYNSKSDSNWPGTKYLCCILAETSVSNATFNRLSLHDGWNGVATNPGAHDLKFNSTEIYRIFLDGVAISDNSGTTSDAFQFIGGAIRDTGYAKYTNNTGRHGVYPSGGHNHLFDGVLFDNNWAGYGISLRRGGVTIRNCTFRKSSTSSADNTKLGIGYCNEDPTNAKYVVRIYNNLIHGNTQQATFYCGGNNDGAPKDPCNTFYIFNNTFINCVVNLDSSLKVYAYFWNNLIVGKDANQVLVTLKTGAAHDMSNNAWWNTARPSGFTNSGDLVGVDPVLNGSFDTKVSSYLNGGVNVFGGYKVPWASSAAPGIGWTSSPRP